MLHVDASETESRANLQDILLDHCQHFILALPLHEHIMLRLICKRFLTHVDSLRYLYYPQHKNDIQQRLASYHVQSLKCDLDDLQNAEYLDFYIQYLINSWIITAPPYNYCQDCLMVDPSETTSAFGVYKIKLHLMHFFEIVTTRIHQALVWWTAEQEETTTIEERIWDATVQDAKRPFGAGLLGRVSNRKWENIQWVENPTTGMRCSRVYHWCGFLQDHLCPITALLLIFSTHPVPT